MPKTLSKYAMQSGNVDPAMFQFLQNFIDAGYLTPYEAGQYLQATPQAQQQRLDQQIGQYSQMLAQSDQEIMGRAGEQLTSQFAQQGRPRSSGYTAAYLNAARDLALARQPQVANFYGQGLQGVNQAYNLVGQGMLDRGYSLMDAQQKRNWDIEDYYRQQNVYNTYLNTQNRKERTGMIGSVAGGVLGAVVGGPLGAVAGSRLGGSAGKMWG